MCVRVRASIWMPFTYLMKVFFSPMFLPLFPSSYLSPHYIVCSCFLQLSPHIDLVQTHPLSSPLWVLPPPPSFLLPLPFWFLFAVHLSACLHGCFIQNVALMCFLACVSLWPCDWWGRPCATTEVWAVSTLGSASPPSLAASHSFHSVSKLNIS